MSRGLFITFEGGEGAGKTTQIKKIAETLRGQGREVVTTREPGGTPEAEKIRDLLVRREGGAWTPEAEMLLLFAARHIHVEQLIKPALAAGKIVVCDRFTDSTRAYQGYGHGLNLAMIESVNRAVLDGFGPDLTFILDVPVDTGLARAGGRLKKDGSGEDRFERLDKAFHERLRQGYLDIARKEPQRCVVLDGLQPKEKITDRVINEVLDRLDRLQDK